MVRSRQKKPPIKISHPTNTDERGQSSQLVSSQTKVGGFLATKTEVAKIPECEIRTK